MGHGIGHGFCHPAGEPLARGWRGKCKLQNAIVQADMQIMFSKSE
jgi:hypothetical protein